MSERTLLRMTAPLREDFAIPYHDLGPADERPRVALVAGLHGDEVNGVFVLARLAAYLRRVSGRKVEGQALRRRVVIVPAVNLLGVNTRSRAWPFDGTDLNRMFPGYDAGETTQRIARAVLEATRGAHYRIDVHSSNLEFEEVPQVRLYEPTAAERASALLFGFPAVIERPVSSSYSATLGCAWRADGGETFILQVGQAGSLQAHHCERLFRALVSFLVQTETLTGVRLAEDDEDIHYFGPARTLPVLSDQAGVFVSQLDVGAWLRVGDPIGQIYDGFEGEELAEVRAPVAGMLSGVRRQPLLFEGDLIARLQTTRDLTAPAARVGLGEAQ